MAGGPKAAFLLSILFSAAGCGSLSNSPPSDAPLEEEVEVGQGDEGQDGAFQGGVPVGGLFVVVEESPPAMKFFDEEGRLVAKTASGFIRLSKVETKWQWLQGFVGASQDEIEVLDTANGRLAPVVPGEVYALLGGDGGEVARIEVKALEGASGVEINVTGNEERFNQVRYRLDCAPQEHFYGLGGQSHASEFRGQTIPIRVAEQGLGKDPNLPEGQASLVGHFYDAYFPLPYLLVVRSDTTANSKHLAYGVVLDTPERSRFLICSQEPDVLEIQGARGSRLRILPGPYPKDVVKGFTNLYGRPNPVPRWAFGPWVAIVGEPKEVVSEAKTLIEKDIPATAVWDQDFNNYSHPDLSSMATALHDMGLKVLTYFNTFLVKGSEEFEEAVSKGYVTRRADGSPYEFDFITSRACLLDLTNEGAWNYMAERLRKAWDTGVDGWMADYGEWIAPDMHLSDGRTGVEYANLYPIDWARLNHEVMAEKRPDPESALFFSRSGYLGSNRYLRVVWAGDQLTSFDRLDGLASVIPYGTSLGLSGVSAFGHDIAGYTGYVAPPSTKELYFRWTEVGALTPVMRTHRGLTYSENWNWDSDEETTAHFRRYALLHLRMLLYLEALHEEAVATGVPAMRHLVLEFPKWDGAPGAHYEFMLGPALLVAPVVEEGAVSRTVAIPDGKWYDFEDGERFGGPSVVTVPAPLDRIPIFLRQGGIVPLLSEDVRSVLRAPKAPSRKTVEEVEQRWLEVRVGMGDEGEFTLRDGTKFKVFEVEGGVIEVRREPEGTDLYMCAPDEDPSELSCYKHEADGRISVADRVGPGTILFGPACTGLGVYGVTVEGGPPSRHYRFRLYTGGLCLQSM